MKKYWWSIIILLAIGVLYVAWYLASPLFIDEVINETSPVIEDTMTLLYEGNFVDADDFHKTSGKVTIFESGRKIYLRFEDFKATNGPDLKVYLSRDLEAKDYISLGDLKGNIGNQNYEIPEEVDINSYNKVLIWCRAFGVLFGSAEI